MGGRAVRGGCRMRKIVRGRKKYDYLVIAITMCFRKNCPLHVWIFMSGRRT